MAGNGGASADPSEETAGGNGPTGLSHLPWQQVPRFIPGTTNVEEYAHRMQFLQSLWPSEHLQHLAPRAALMVEGSAFHKISRIKPEKLKSDDGVKLLVEALGGAWGKTAVEEKYHYFEQAMFQVAQKADESNDSYISRHDMAFEELLSRKTTLEEVRAYILLRHSQLAPEDKKRVVVEAKGDLKYQDTVKQVRLLGSRFFNDLHHRGKGGDRTKVYDVNAAFEEETSEEILVAAMGTEEDCEEEILAAALEKGDEDALYIAEFEESIIDAVQESDLAPIFTSYLEARQRLRDKAKSRGYFPLRKGKGAKGMTKKGKGGNRPFDGHRRQSLADRIANSTCRICGAKGHWKRECPKREDRTEISHFTQAEMSSPFATEILRNLPEDAVYYTHEDGGLKDSEAGTLGTEGNFGIQGSRHICLLATPEVRSVKSSVANIEAALARRFSLIARMPPKAKDHLLQRSTSEATSGLRPDSGKAAAQRQATPMETALVLTVGAEGVLDTGASRTVLGEDRVEQMLQGLPQKCRREVRKVASEVTFRFGNSGTLSSKHALLLPAADSTWIRVEIIPGNTPLLISNRLLRDLNAVIYVRKGYVTLGDGSSSIQMRMDERGLSIVDLAELLRAPGSRSQTCEAWNVTADSEHNQQSNPQPHPQQQQEAAAPTSVTTAPEQHQQPSSAQTLDSPQGPSPTVRRQHADIEPPSRGEDAGQASNRGSRRTVIRGGEHATRRGDTVHHGLPRGDLHTTHGDQQPEGVGSCGGLGGQASQPLFRGHLREGPSIRFAHGTEANVDECMGAFVQRVCSGSAQDNGSGGTGSVGGTQGQSQSQAATDDQNGGAQRPRGVEAMPAINRQDRGSNEHGKQPDGKESQPTGEEHQLSDATRPLDGGDQHPAGDSRAGAYALEGCREHCSPRLGGRQGVKPGEYHSDGRGKGCMNEAASPWTVAVTEVCDQIENRILMIEQQLQHESREERESISKYRLPSLDVLEVSLEDSGKLSPAVRRYGGRAASIPLTRGNPHEQQMKRIQQTIIMYEPQHIWMDLGDWSREASRCQNKLWLETLIRELFLFQTERGHHFHLVCGQSFFSQWSDFLDEVRHGMLRTVTSLSEQGAVPKGNNHLRKQHQFYTTSRQLQQTMDTRWTERRPQPASAEPSRNPRFRHFVDQVALGLRCVQDQPLVYQELLLGEHKREGAYSDLPDVTQVQQVLKRRRLRGKQAAPQGTSNGDEGWMGVFRRANDRVPVKRRFYVWGGDCIVQDVQRLIPDLAVQVGRAQQGDQQSPAATSADAPAGYARPFHRCCSKDRRSSSRR